VDADGPLLAGRFRLGPRLGGGSQGETFLARDERPDERPARDGARLCVVKRMIPRGTWKAFELFEREGKVLSQLRHPGVPRTLATFEEPPGTFNLVMERMPGDNLRALTARRRLAELELVDILTRTLEILDYLHRRAPVVIHRDIKPSNILRAPDGKISLIDFGGVRDRAGEGGGSTIVGTFGYMAPEQLHGQCTPATDLYALGATIVALAGGVEPEDVPRRGLRMDLDRHLPSLDPGLRRVLTAMTDPDPDARPQRARDVIALLAERGRAAPANPTGTGAALALRGVTLPARVAPGRLFPTVPEPAGTALRLGVLGFGATGWLTMMWIRVALMFTVGLLSLLAFPVRRKLSGLGDELDLMLKEGQDGFADISRRAIGRTRSPD
jgi:serine/threonine protein kinase